MQGLRSRTSYHGSFFRSPDRKLRNRRMWRRRRGVSEVIATILLLGITVTLFSSVFLLLNRFPKPLPQGTDQFQASLIVNTTASPNKIVAVKIVLTSGSSVPASGSVYLVLSKSVAGNWQFGRANGVPVRWGFNNSSTSWTSGMTWYSAFKAPPTLPNNLSVAVVGSGVLLFQVTLTGSTATSPPSVVSTYIVSSQTGGQLTVGAPFWVNSTLAGNLKGATATIYLGGVPGLSKSSLTYTINTATGAGSFHVTPVSAGTTTTPGSYVVFIQGNNSAGQTFSGSATVTIASTAGAAPVTVSVSVSPSPPTDRTNVTLSAVISNSGSKPVNISAVKFYTNATTNGVTWTPNGTIAVASGLPLALPSGQSVAVSAVWLPGPNVTSPKATGVSITAVVSYGGAIAAIGSKQLVVSGAPFAASVQTPMLDGIVISTSANWLIPIEVVNYGTLGNSVVNITVYVNNSGSVWTGTVKYPAPSYGLSTSAGPAYATPASGIVLGQGATLLTNVLYAGPGGVQQTLTVTILVSISNAVWGSLIPTKLALKATYAFLD